jgi:hypothetical protein
MNRICPLQQINQKHGHKNAHKAQNKSPFLCFLRLFAATEKVEPLAAASSVFTSGRSVGAQSSCPLTSGISKFVAECAAPGAQNERRMIQNPIIPGFFPDPGIRGVGDGHSNYRPRL